MASSHAHTHFRFVKAILAAGVLVLAGALAGTADARHANHPVTHHAKRHGRPCARHHRHTRRARCARTARVKHRPAHARPAAHTKRAAHTTVSPPAALAAVPSGPCPDAELMPTAANLAEVRAATLCLINKLRIQSGEQPLSDNGKLDAAAQGHSADMVAGNYFGHTTPSGEEFGARIDAAGYVPAGWSYELGENIECGTLSLATPSGTVNGWMNSPEHRANILNGDFRESGIGVVPAAPAMYAEGQPGATYTQDFGVVASS
jgi:uncharacterized protein YkwD